jgi:hypothetical protein
MMVVSLHEQTTVIISHRHQRTESQPSGRPGGHGQQNHRLSFLNGPVDRHSVARVVDRRQKRVAGIAAVTPGVVREPGLVLVGGDICIIVTKVPGGVDGGGDSGDSTIVEETTKPNPRERGGGNYLHGCCVC